MANDNNKMWDERLAPRKKLSQPVEVTIEAQTFAATMLDVSKSGMRIQANNPLPLTVKINTAEGVKTFTMDLVWSRNSEDGMVNYGLRMKENL